MEGAEGGVGWLAAGRARAWPPRAPCRTRDRSSPPPRPARTQVRLCLDRGDFVRAHILSKKVSPRAFASLDSKARAGRH